MKLLVAIALVTGCFPVNKSTTLVKRVTDKPVVATRGDLELQSELIESSVVVIASWPRECRRDTREVETTTTKRELELLGRSNHALLPVWILLVAVPWIGIPEMAGSVVAVIADSGTTTSRSRVVDSQTEDCSEVAPDVPIELVLASGATISGVTDDTGTFQFLMPPDEHGPVIVRASSVAPPGLDADELGDRAQRSSDLGGERALDQRQRPVGPDRQ